MVLDARRKDGAWIGIRSSSTLDAHAKLKATGESAMRVMVIVKATKDSEFGGMPPGELLADMGAFNQALIDAGLFVDAGGLKDSRKGARVAFSGKDRTVTKGPFRHSASLPRATGFGKSRPSTKRSTGSSAAPTRCPGLRSSRSARCSRWRTSLSRPRGRDDIHKHLASLPSAREPLAWANEQRPASPPQRLTGESLKDALMKRAPG